MTEHRATGAEPETVKGSEPGHVQEPDLIPDWEMAPGGPRAVSMGCLCSVLANAAFRARAEVHPCIDPRCPLHATTTPPSPSLE